MAHLSDTRQGGHQYRPWVRVGTAVLACVAVVVAIVFATAQWRGSNGTNSTQAACVTQELQVTADPRIAPVLADATTDLAPWANAGECIKVVVTASSSSTTASEVARPAGQGLSAPLPDVWVPDSSLWLAAARSSDVGSRRLAGAAVSVATSPVVIAMARSRAEALGWPDTQPSWRQLLGKNTSKLRLAMTDPRVDTAGLSSVLSLLKQSSTTIASLARRLTVPMLGERSAAQAVADGEVGAIPSTEQDVILVNRQAQGRGVAAAYDPHLNSGLNFPMVTVTPDEGLVSPQTTHAIAVLREALLDPASQGLLPKAGLRDAFGNLDVTYGDQQGVTHEHWVDPPRTAPVDVSAVFDGWASSGRRFNVLVVVDRSGSMSEPLPGGNATKAELAQASLRSVVHGMAPDSDMGLWSFTTGLPRGDTDKLVPIGPINQPVSGSPLPTRRKTLLTAIGGLDPVVNGGTPLYNTVAAAYNSALANYTYGRLNAVIVVTDGRNQSPGSISLSSLIKTLRLGYDGVRPVRILTIAYGADADTSTLRRIAAVTGGRSYVALSADEVGSLFTSALAGL